MKNNVDSLSRIILHILFHVVARRYIILYYETELPRNLETFIRFSSKTFVSFITAYSMSKT